MFFREKKKEIPLLPLRDVILFPSQVLPLLIGRSKSRAALLSAFAGDKTIILVMQTKGDMAEPSPEDVYSVGVESKIIQLLRMPDDNYKVLIEGQKRVFIEKINSDGEYWKVQVSPFTEKPFDDEEGQPLIRAIHERFSDLVKLNSKIPAEMVPSIQSIQEGPRLADALIPYLPMKPPERQKFIEEEEPLARLKQILEFIQAEIDMLEIDKQIKKRVKDQMEKNQREYYLNEKMQAIQKELGDKTDGSNEWTDYMHRLQQADLSPEAEERVKRELRRLKKMSPMSAEATVCRSYIDWILSLPWNESISENNDLTKARNILEAEHYGLQEVKERILEHLAVQQLNANGRHPILCLVGPPGVGKTSLAQSISNATGRPYVRQALGGVRDESEIRGHRRTYIGSMPGKLIQSMRRAGKRNPIFLLDEVDKMASDFHHGDPAAALLEALDPEQNDTFRDHYLDLDFDLSKVLFICTANDLRGISGPLQDRLEIIQLNSYTELEKLAIAKKYLIPKQVALCGLQPEQVHFSQNSVTRIVREYTREAGVRNLEREISKACRKVARQQVESGEDLKVWISADNLPQLLGSPKFQDKNKDLESKVGVVNGLAVTPWGGEVLEIEVAITPGKGELLLTGRLGDWLKESARAALTFVRSRASELGLEENFHKEIDIHIHYPGNGLKTDGPSAGMAMAFALISALTKRPFPGNIAMTGEISLRGRILPIGGVKEKMLAAHRRKMTIALLPKANENAIDDLPEIVTSELDIRTVSHIDQAMEIVFDSFLQKNTE